MIRSVEYDGNGNLVQRTEQLYDGIGRLSSQNWVIGSTAYSEAYTYDDPTDTDTSGDGSLSTVTTGTGDTVAYTYDNLRRLQKETVTNAQGAVLLRTAYDFATISGNQSSMQVRYRNVCLGTSDSVLEGNQYTYDGVGNITVISQSTGNYYPLVKYSYDELGQMVKEVYYDGEGDADSNITATYDYTYDTAGNILTKSKNGTVTKTYSYNDGAWRDLLTAVNGTAISYENGNPLNYHNGEKSYSNLMWENGRQLASIMTGGNTYSYSYDFDGIRTQKIVDGVTHTYVTQNGKVVRESYGNIVMDFIYDNAGNPFALRYSTNGGSSYATYYYVLNLQGDVVKLVRIYAGTTIQEYAEMASYTYNAWGEIISSSGSMADINPLRYRGYYYDTETGFYYLQSRYYDPANHRFINADGYASTGQGFLGFNMFAYCLNNPISMTDTTGQVALFWQQSVYDGRGGGHLEREPVIRDVTDEINAALSKAASEGERFRELLSSDPSILESTAIITDLYLTFYKMVDHKAPWDIKEKESWEATIGTPFPGRKAVVKYCGMTMTAEALGNFTYGYLGHAYCFPMEILSLGSLYAAGFPTEGEAAENERIDQAYIHFGYCLYPVLIVD